MKKWIVPTLVVCLVAGGGFYYYRQNQAKALRAAATRRTLPTVAAKRGTIESTITGTASIVYSDRRVIQSTVSGTMGPVLVKDGQTVKAGDLLASIENQTVLDDLEQARMDLENLMLRVEGYRTVTPTNRANAETKLQQAEEALENRKKDLTKLSVVAPLDGRVANLAIRQGQSVSANQTLFTVAEDTSVLVVAQVAQNDISRISVGQTASVGFGSELPSTAGKVVSIGVQATSGSKSATVPVNIKVDNPGGVYRIGLMANVFFSMTNSNGDPADISATATVAALSTYDVKAEVSGTVESIAVSQGASVKQGQVTVELKNDSLARAVKYAENDLVVAREAYDRIASGYAPNISDTDLKQAESQIRQAETRVRMRTEAADALQVRAPIDGVVLSHSLDETAAVTSGNTLFVMSDPNKMHMVVPVDELDIMQVKIGQKAAITVDAIPGQTFAGTVSKLGSEGSVKDGLATYDVTVTVDLPKGLRGSMTGTAVITLAKKDDVIVVPAEAVRTDGKRKYVTVSKNGANTQVDVTVGITGRSSVEIVSGLKEGDMVVVTPTTTNQNGPTRVIMPGMPGMGPRGG